MDKQKQRINLALNLAIVLVVILIGVVIARNYLLSSRPPAHRNYLGTKVNLAGIDWARNEQTLLLVLDEACRFCTESAPFYQRLANETSANSRVRLVAVLPQGVAEGRRYLLNLKVPIDEVRQSGLDALGVEGTPTLILVNAEGEVMEAWAGKLAPDKENEVLKRIEATKAAGRR